jgi:hypothetical protein
MFYAKKGHVDLVLKNALPPIGSRKGQGYNCFVCHKPQHKMQTYKVRNKKNQMATYNGWPFEKNYYG